jgi:glycosyltransferase involved in cell wall biosynthesis
MPDLVPASDQPVPHRLPPVPAGPPTAHDVAELAAATPLRRVHLISWRDLDDVEAGGSEVHAHNVAKRWAAAGLEVQLRTSYAQGRAPIVTRDGYRVVRRAGRYLVFPRAAVTEALQRNGPWDGLVEIWNGMPFFAPLWAAGRPHVVFLHHVHGEMWRMTFEENPRLGQAGELLERRIAPLLYRRSRIVTLSTSSKEEIVDDLGFRAHRVDVVPPGVDPRFSPGGERSPHPLVVAVGRLVPVKRYDVLLRVLAELKRTQPDLEAVVVSEGYERPSLEALRHELGADDWIHLPGWISDDAVVDLYRRAWALVSASAREGWNMSITEAGACGTPGVVTDIAGHRDAVAHGESGYLVSDVRQLGARISEVLGDDVLRKQLGEGALAHAARFTWDATAYGTLRALAEEAVAKRARRAG